MRNGGRVGKKMMQVERSVRERVGRLKASRSRVREVEGEFERVTRERARQHVRKRSCERKQWRGLGKDSADEVEREKRVVWNATGDRASELGGGLGRASWMKGVGTEMGAVLDAGGER